MPKLSVILPARNAETTIDKAIKSTLAAMPKDSELVVYDDGSTDSTPSVLSQVEDRRLRILSSLRPDGSGVATALNTLLNNTDSEFVARMDADDISFRHRFWLQGRQLKGLGAEVLFGTIVHFGAGFPIPRPSIPTRISTQAMPIALLISNPVAHSTMYARRRTLDNAGGYRSGPAEDYELWLRLTSNTVPIARGAAPVLAYRHHHKQVTADSAWQDNMQLDPNLNAAYRHCLKTVLDTEGKKLPQDRMQQSLYRDELSSAISKLRSRNDKRYLNRFMSGKFAKGMTEE